MKPYGKDVINTMAPAQCVSFSFGNVTPAVCGEV